MNVLGLGLDFSGRLLFPAVDEEHFFDSLVGALDRNAARVRDLTRSTSEAVSFRGEVERFAEDPGDPRSAGWTYLVNANDPLRQEIQRVLEPLAQHRGMRDPQQPLLYAGEPQEAWGDWLHDNYYALALEGETVPQYMLIVGGPDQVPFLLQSLLHTVANVGRLDFPRLDDLQAYVDKLLRIESASEPVVSREAFLFAPDHGLPDPTYFSREYMAVPLGEHVEDDLRVPVRSILGDEATKPNLMAGLAGNPALVYTASHGLGAVGEPLERQKRYNGAICCQHEGRLTPESLFSADDVPQEGPFLEGAVFFQFACFGYGTPAQSDFAHWLEGVPENYSPTDFVAALPRRLVGHPRGPIAYIGHLDTAFLHGFAHAANPHVLDRWHTRIAPFVRAVQRLLGVQPCGLAMRDINTRYSVCNALITNTYDCQRRGRLQWNARLKARFLDNWILRGDSQNYMIFGDPGARLRIPET